MRVSGCLDRSFIVAVVPVSHTQDTTYEELCDSGRKAVGVLNPGVSCHLSLY